MHNELDGGVWEAIIMKAGAEKFPINIIKSFLMVKFESDISLFLLGSQHKVNNFLQNSGIMRSTPTWQKTVLSETNYIIK